MTPLPQRGNPRPRLFRLPEDGGVINLNRNGFNNSGLDAGAARLLGRDRSAGIVGANVGANKGVETPESDYAAGVRTMAPLADYITINVSSPNTPGLRDLQHGDALDRLLGTLREAQTRLDQQRGVTVPLVIKIAPDNSEEELAAMAEAFVRHGIDGVCVGNTTLERPGVARLRHGDEQGGLSGAPLKPIADRALATMAKALDGRIPIIGVGGISGAGDALDKRRLGASLVQVYSGLIYQGPGLVGDIVRAW